MKFSGTTISTLTQIPALTAAGDFQLHRVHLVRAGCPVTLMGIRANQSVDMPIVIACNKEKHGYVASTNYYPKAVVVAGASRRSRLLADAVLASWAWVENGAMEINASDAMSSSELFTKLTAVLASRYVGKTLGLPGQETPWLVEVHPFENYSVFSFKGQKYRQSFMYGNADRNVILTGLPSKADEMTACGDANGLHGTNVGKLPLSQTGARFAYAPVPGNNQTATHGGRNSELVTQIVRNWTNINEAAAMYVNAIQHGLYTPMQPSFHPVALPKDGRITTALASQGIAPADFAIWSEGAQKKSTKTYDGEEIHRRHFAYVGKRSDPSTWKLPVDTADRAMYALSRINQTHDIPADKKPEVLQRIQQVAGRKSKAVGVGYQ